jgi:hypothetical protein
MAKHLSNAPGGGGGGGKPWNPYVLSSNPTYWWKMAEASGTTAVDSADSNTGTYNPGAGSVTLAEPSIIPGSADTCALYASGASEVGSIDDLTYPGGGYSAVIAFKCTGSVGTVQALAGLYNNGGGGIFYTVMSLYLDTSGYLTGGTDDGSGTFQSVSASTNLIDGNAHLAGITWTPGSPGTVTIYADGVKVGTVSPAGETTPGSMSSCAAFTTEGYNGGHSGLFRRYVGYLQSYIVWDTLLTDADMANLFVASKL